MSKLQSLRVFLNDRLTAAAVEIFGAVEKTVVEYQEENDRLRRLLLSTPEIRRVDSLQFSLSEEDVLPEQQHCEQEWSPSLGQEDPEPTQIKEEQEELRTSQEEEQLQGLFDSQDLITLSPPCVKRECDQQNPLWTLPPTLEKREHYSKPVGLKPSDSVTHLNGFDIPCDPPDNKNNASGQISVISSDRVGLQHSLTLHQYPPIAEYRTKHSTTFMKTYCCRDCGETFSLKDDLQSHVLHAQERTSVCSFCRKQFNSTCQLKSHVRLCHGGKPYTCPVCGKSFKLKGVLSRHMVIHTGDKQFSCGDCGKSFYHKGDLKKHKLTHTGEKPFSCVYCGKSYSQKGDLTRHVFTHTGEKPYGCSLCGRTFNRKANLLKHVNNVHKQRDTSHY